MYYFEDMVKKDNPKLFQGGQQKIITDGKSIPFDTNDVIDYTKKNPYFSFTQASNTTDLDKPISINNLPSGINVIKVDLKNYKKNQTLKFNINLRFIQKLNTKGLDSFIQLNGYLGNDLIKLKNGKIDNPINLTTDGIIYMNDMESSSYQPINIKTSNEYVFLVIANCKGTFNFNFSKINKCPPKKVCPPEKLCPPEKACVEPNYTFYQGAIVSLVLIVFSIIIYNMLNSCKKSKN